MGVRGQFFDNSLRILEQADLPIIFFTSTPMKTSSRVHLFMLFALLWGVNVRAQQSLRESYIEEYAQLAVAEMNRSGIPASITLAQGILESGNGQSELARKSNNHFGIKCHAKWKGERVYHDDDEKGECFRKYQYVETSYHDHSAFLTKRKRYSFLFNYRLEDYKRWAKGLKKAGYATDKKYPKKLISIIENYKLYKFDKVKRKNFKFKKKPKTKVKPKYTVGNYYEVKKGDTLYSIAKKFQTSVATLKELNGLNTDIISEGQHLLTK